MKDSDTPASPLGRARGLCHPQVQRAKKPSARVAASAALRTVARANVIAWREHLDTRKLAPASIRRKLTALSSMFDSLWLLKTPKALAKL